MDRAYMWKKQAAAVFFPQRKCPVCGGFSRQGACAGCLRDLAALRPCPVCATFIAPTESEFYRCRGCREEEPHFEQARAAGYGMEDMSAVIKLWEKLMGVEIRGELE